MPKKTVRDVDLAHKRVLVRVDFNVPLDEKDGAMVVTDTTRIDETVPTLQFLKEKGARIVLMSHLGRPKGKPDPKQSLKPAAEILAKRLNESVAFFDESVTDSAALESLKGRIAALNPGQVAVLENTRFYAGEEDNDEALGRAFAALCDVYVNDAFGSAHRAHSSTEAVARFAPHAVSGLLMERELKFLGEELERPERPFVVILGGAKVSDKIGVIDALLDRADVILIGGGMAYTFKLALGESIGKSLSEPDKKDIAKQALDKAKSRGVKFLLPTDNYIVQEMDFKAKTVGPGKFTKPGEGIPDGWEGVDIGPETIDRFKTEIRAARTVLWNGPMGVFEIADCAKGTVAIAEEVAANRNAKTIIGGGDSVKAIKKAGVADKVTFISTGGGASLEFLEGKTLPGVAALADA